MNKEDIPEGFKKTEIGPIPENWRAARLGDVVEFTKKPKGMQISRGGKVPFIPMDSIPTGGVFFSNCLMKEMNEIASGVYFMNGDLLLSKITPCFENGKQGIARELPLDFGFASTEVIPVHEKKDISHLVFIHFFLLRRDIRNLLASKMEGTTGRRRLSKSVLEDLVIPLPPLPEQKGIAAMLSTIQEAKEKTQAVIEATKALKKSLMKHLFTYGPVSLEETSTIPLKDTEIGTIPKHWRIVKFEEILKHGTQNGIYKPRSEYGSGTPIVDMKDIFASDVLSVDSLENLVISKEELRKYSLDNGDLLFARRSFKPAGAGKCQLVEELQRSIVFSSSIIRVSPKQQEVNSRFLMYLFESPFGRSIMNRIVRHLAVSGISGSDLKMLLVPLPPLFEQEMIGRVLQTVDTKTTVYASVVSSSDTLFGKLLEELVTGTRRVGTWEALA